MRLSETQKAIRDQFRRFMQQELEPKTPAFESGEELPFELMRKMVVELGLAAEVEQMGREKPAGEAGNAKSDSDSQMKSLFRFAQNQLMIEMSRVNPGYALSFGASVGLFGMNLRNKGTPEQVARYFQPIVRAEKIGCWCLTEPGAGSDALRAMRTRAHPDGNDYVLSGEKTFITNAPYADLFLVYAKDERDVVHAFIVEKGAEGLTVSKPFRKMGMKSSPTGAVYLDEVRVPRENLLGGGIADRDHVRESLVTERMGLAVMGYGIAERCFEIAVAYARNRVQGGHPISSYQMIQQRLARMYVALSNARRIIYEEEEMSALDVCAGKLYAAEVGTFVALESIHILGGYGYMEEYVVERLARDAKLVEIGGGTTEVQILTIGRHILEQY